MVTVRPRVVAPPWEREALDGSRSTWVGREAEVVPEAGPLELYRARFPTRAVSWHVPRQLFVITDSGVPGWREFVCELDAPPDPERGTPRSPEELAAMVEAGDFAVTRVFRHFDYVYVHRRLREAFEFVADGPERYTHKIADRNRALTRSRTRSVAHRNAAALNEIRRYYPVLAGDGKKVPLVPGGCTR